MTGQPRKEASVSTSAPILRATDLTHHYGRSERILDNVQLAVGTGEIVAVVGRSGCGKSTLLHLLAGFAKPSRGGVWLGDRPVTKPSPSCVLMFQEPSLYPWMTVAENIELGPKFSGRGEDVRAELSQLLRLVQLEEYADTNVQRLSGGQQQRVAFARALAARPQVLLLDEPFSGLDPLTRTSLQQDVRQVTRRLGLTLMIVTHDFDEAVAMADRVLVLAGRPARIISEIPVEIAGQRSRDTLEFRRTRARLADMFYGADPARPAQGAAANSDNDRYLAAAGGH
jgi:NitT/TauT family transport system ATP-binding protein